MNISSGHDLVAHPQRLRRHFHESSTLIFGIALLASSTHAAELYSEGFDTDAGAKVKIYAGSSTITATSVDYSNLTIGATTHQIVEAPSQIPGSAPTRGFLMRQKYDGSTARIINVLLTDPASGLPKTFSGSYRLKFDLFLNCGPSAVNGTTEVGLFGIGNDDVGRCAYVNRTATTPMPSGTWGWLATEGGIGLTGDVGLYDIKTLLARHDDANANDAPLFQSAFSANSLPRPYAPAQHWTRVVVECVANPPPDTTAKVTVYFNGIRFLEGFSTHTAGFAMFGYEDAFPTSNSDTPESQFGLVDNVVVETISPYEIWSQQFFVAGSPDSLPLADPDFDHVVNLLEYTFGLNPLFDDPKVPVDPNNPNNNSQGMTPVTEYLPSPKSLRISFVRRTGEAGVNFAFDVATTPLLWTPLPLDGATITPLANGWELVQFTAAASTLGAAGDRSFFGRLHVTGP